MPFRTSYLLLVAFISLMATAMVNAQSPITTINVASSAAPDSQYNQTAPSDAGNNISSGVTYTVRNGQGNDLTVTSYVVGGITYDNFLVPDTVAIRRTDGSRFINIWYSLIQINTGPNPDQLDLDPRAVADADLIYQTRNINAGYDNILVNDDDLASGSIQAQTERVDIIWRTGIVTCEPDNAVFPVVERGGNDNIRVAAITSLDANGDPNGYSPTVLISSSDWTGTGQTFNNYLILRRQTLGQNPLPLLNIGTIAGQTAQTVQGVAVSFSELDIMPNQVVYGYSIFASDTDETIPGIDLTDINTFPTTTLSSVSGLDLVAGVTAAVSSDACLTPAVGPGGYKAALSTWLKANSGVTTSSDGSAVTDWQDQWVGDHDATTSTGSPLYRSTVSNINFNPTVEFGAGANTLNIANNTDFNIGGPYTTKGINLAFRTGTGDISTRQVLYEQGGNSRGINIYLRAGNLHVSGWNRASDGAGSPWNDSGNISTISTPLATNTEYIVTLEYNGNSSSTGTITAYLNGQSFGSLTGIGLLYNHTGGIELGGNDGNTRFDDGSDGGTNSYFGEISELIYCNEPGGFPTAQRNRIESYLALKYGITLDQSTAYSYVNSSGTVIFNTSSSAAIGGYLEYNNDIAGIGRDDNSEFEQQRSRSENSGSVVTMDHGTSFNNNDSWLIWGNDGGLTSDTESTDVPPLVSQRVERIWRVGETGETGNNSISFDISNLSIAGSPIASDYSLLVAGNSSGGDFSSASVITGGILVGNTLTFNNVDFSNGQYFTLGTAFIDCAPGDVSSNLTLWLKADLGTGTVVNGANVSTWTDQAGGNNATAPSGDEPNYATASINYNPALNFDAANTEELTGTAGFNSSAYYIVLNTDLTYNSSSTNELVLEFTVPAAATNQFGSLLFGSVTSAITNEVVTHALGGTSTRWRRGISQTSFGTVNIDNTYMFGIKNNAANNSTEMFINGRNYADLVSGTFMTSTNVAYRIGGNLDANTFVSDNFDGQIAEVISFSARPSDAEHARIQSYLALKYGISLSQTSAQNYVNSSGSVVWNATTNATHNNDIAGIGRDDGSCLQQKQSKSENDDDIVAIGNGGLFASNSANPNSFSSDNSFLIWGNDNGSTDESATNSVDVPGTVTERMARVWKVDETGTVGNTTVSFDLSGLGYSSTASDFQLIISPTSTMASGTTISGGTFNGDVLTFNNVDFADGDFFTLGTAREICGPGGVTTSLALWLRADGGTSTTVDGASLSTWADQSTANRNANQVNLGGASPVAPSYETSEINFNPAISIKDPGSTNAAFMETSNGNNVSEDMTLIAVFETGQAGGSTTNFEDAPAIIGGGDSGGNADYGIGISAGRLHFNAANNASLNARSPSGTVYNDFEPYIVTGTRVRSTAAGSIQLYVNSVNVASAASTNTSLTGPGSFGIGNHDDANVASQFNGRIAEAIVFSNDLTSAERQRVESYLAIKYGITRAGAAGFQDYLASDGGIVWDWDEQPVYSNDIAGVARDDNGCFLQPKSKSENNDAIVTMEVSGALTTDDSYMLWGNDNVALEGTRAEGNTEYNSSQVQGRLFREWYVQETGTVGSVNLTFDLSTITGPMGTGTNNLNQLRLMVDGDGDFTSGTTLISPSSVNAVSNTVTFAVNFTDGQFFTLGSVENASLPVTLVSFGVKVTTEKNVLIEWATAGEENNAFFTVERSSDGLVFENIATLRGAGNSEDINYYDHTDTKPLKGTAYYRLRQTDLNGGSTTSEVKRVHIAEIIEDVEEYKLFPNPIASGQELTFVYTVLNQIDVSINVMDTKGVIYKRLQATLSPETGHVGISTTGLLPGLYVVVITDLPNNRSKSFKLIVR